MSLVFHKVQQHSKWRSSSPTAILSRQCINEDQIHKKGYPKGFLQRAFVEATGLLLIQPGTADKIRPYALQKGGTD